jgi:predicted nucleotidyltransferase component of viral defense system
MKNYAESVRTRLNELGRRENIWFNYLITRYLHERFLYRLSKSSYTDNFCLKGGALLYALEGISARQTRDLDLLGRHLSNAPENLKSCFEEILSIEFENDGVVFDIASLSTSEITKEGNYKGTRLEFWAILGQIREKMQVDVGFGDIVVPAPVLMQFPTLLDLPAPEIQAYSVETVIAEKFHAMIQLGELNSRMKDYYDLHCLLRPDRINPEVLPIAINETFKARGSTLSTDTISFLSAFVTNEDRRKQWVAFLKKSRLDPIDFEEVVNFIQKEIMPFIDVVQRMSEGKYE